MSLSRLYPGVGRLYPGVARLYSELLDFIQFPQYKTKYCPESLDFTHVARLYAICYRLYPIAEYNLNYCRTAVSLGSAVRKDVFTDTL